MNEKFNRPRKRYGQHFLHDRNIIEKIIGLIAPDKNGPIIEIGPGRGAITFPLLERVDRLDVVEIDRDLAGKLKENEEYRERLFIHQTDALSFDFSSLHKEKVKVFGNLPYNISTPLLFHLLEQMHCIDEMVFMLQKEVVERICAIPDTKDYGRLSVMIQSHCDTEKLLSVGTRAFTPPPKVDSAVIRLKPNPSRVESILNMPLFKNIVKNAFNYRRKTLRNALKTIVTETQFDQCNIPSTSRAENLSVEQFILLANTVHQRESID